MKSILLVPFVILGLAAAAPRPITAQAAPRLSAAMPPSELRTLDAIRRAVWVDWFTGDTAKLRAILTPDLVAMSADAAHWQTLDQAIASSAGFKASGATFIDVKFDSTTVHRFGDVVVMFSHYAVTTESGGKREVMAGRATEVFVRRDGRWLHTSWHLDVL